MIISPKRNDFNPLFHSVGCICTYKGNILLLKRMKTCSFPFKWGIPTGKIGPNETPKKTIIRELYEETQIVCSSENLHFIDSFQIENDDMNFLYDLFVLELAEEREIIINPKEHIEYRWIEFKDFHKFDLVPDVKETVAIGLDQNVKTTQLDLFGHPVEENEVNFSVFEKLQDVELSHQSFKNGIDFTKKWYVAFGPPGVGKTTTLKEINIKHPEICIEDKYLKKILELQRVYYQGICRKRK